MKEEENMTNELQLFENQPIRKFFNKDDGEWYFSIVDVIGVLTEQPDSRSASNHWRKLKQRLKEEGNEFVTNCHQLKMEAADGKYRLTDVANTEQLLRLIQSIPSKKAEPFKLWLAKVGKERIDEENNPELIAKRLFSTYDRKGYSKKWQAQRIQSIAKRNMLTDEWQSRGVEGNEYAILTDDVTQGCFGMTTGEYKDFKGLTKKESLRDNMSITELALNTLAEVATLDISQQEEPETFEQNRDVTQRGGGVAGVARMALEKELKKSVITSQNFLINRFSKVCSQYQG